MWFGFYQYFQTIIDPQQARENLDKQLDKIRQFLNLGLDDQSEEEQEIPNEISVNIPAQVPSDNYADLGFDDIPEFLDQEQGDPLHEDSSETSDDLPPLLTPAISEDENGPQSEKIFSNDDNYLLIAPDVQNDINILPDTDWSNLQDDISPNGRLYDLDRQQIKSGIPTGSHLNPDLDTNIYYDNNDVYSKSSPLYLALRDKLITSWKRNSKW